MTTRQGAGESERRARIKESKRQRAEEAIKRAHDKEATGKAKAARARENNVRLLKERIRPRWVRTAGVETKLGINVGQGINAAVGRRSRIYIYKGSEMHPSRSPQELHARFEHGGKEVKIIMEPYGDGSIRVSGHGGAPSGLIHAFAKVTGLEFEGAESVGEGETLRDNGIRGGFDFRLARGQRRKRPEGEEAFSNY